MLCHFDSTAVYPLIYTGYEIQKWKGSRLLCIMGKERQLHVLVWDKNLRSSTQYTLNVKKQ
jgi:hypothetical protein